MSAGGEAVALADGEAVASATENGALSEGLEGAGRATGFDVPSPSSNGSGSVAPVATTMAAASTDEKATSPIPERLPIRRSYRRRRLRAWSTLLCVLVLVVAAVLLVMASRAG